MKLVTLALLFSGLLNHLVLGQPIMASTQQKGATRIGPQTSKLPTPPDEFHQMLARSNGAWTGQATMTFAADAPPVTSTSTLTNTMARWSLPSLGNYL